MKVRPVALTIAGSDPSGGAGIQADLKTFHEIGAYGCSAITLLTVQNTRRVSRVELLPAWLVSEQIDAVLEDLPPRAVKTGALGSAAAVRAVAARSFPCPLVVDPVMIATRGAELLAPEARAALWELLLPRASLVTPNLAEAAILAGCAVEDPPAMRRAAERIAASGVGAVLVKGGHLTEGDALDILFHKGVFTEYRTPHTISRHTHGTGCTFSAAITAFLAFGMELEDAVGRAKAFIAEAIRTAPGLGGGDGPVNHWAGRSNRTDDKSGSV